MNARKTHNSGACDSKLSNSLCMNCMTGSAAKNLRRIHPSGRKRVHTLCKNQSVMLHGTSFTISDALILPGGSHWYKFDNKHSIFS